MGVGVGWGDWSYEYFLRVVCKQYSEGKPNHLGLSFVLSFYLQKNPARVDPLA